MHVLFFGDSLTLGYGDAEYLGWPGRLCRDALAAHAPGRALGLTAYNLGARRHFISQVRERWREEAERRLAPGEPALLVFCLGAVDALRGAPQPESTEAARLLLLEARDEAPCLLVSPPPVADPANSARIAALTKALHGVAAGLHIPFLDVYHPLAADEDYMRDLAASDGIHPTGHGYGLLARRVGAWDAFTDALHKGLTAT